MLELNGRKVKANVLKATFTDNSGLTADSMELIVEDNPIRLSNRNIIYYENNGIESGVMFVDDWGIIGGNLHIYAKKYEDKVKKEYVFRDAGFIEIAQEICNKEGYVLKRIDGNGWRYKYIYSKGKSALGLIAEMCKLENKRIKLKGKEVYIVDMSYAQDVKNIVLDEENGSYSNYEKTHRLGVISRGDIGYATDEIAYSDIERVIYKYNADDIYTARRWARGLLTAENMEKEKISFSTSERLTALDKIYVTGDIAPEDLYTISKVTTNMLNGESCVTAERMRRVSI